MQLTDSEWATRLFIYQFFVEHARPPLVAETAAHFQISPDEARQRYHRLHDAHTLFLDPGTDNIRMASPLSAVPTDYSVTINGTRLWANCAWDSLGIPAMLHADAQIEATIRPSGETVNYAVKDGVLKSEDGLIVQFALPFTRWYDDLIHT